MSALLRRVAGFMTLISALLVAVPAASQLAYLQCAPFARAESGIQLFGAARDWWAQAAGRYARGAQPRPGAVMHFPASRGMPGGHVAVVSSVVSAREVLITHANWSPINGRRGQIERNVRAVDVSPAGDWSEVRIWYAPIHDLGLRVNRVSGFIYPSAADGPASQPDQPSRTLADIAASVAG